MKQHGRRTTSSEAKGDIGHSAMLAIVACLPRRVSHPAHPALMDPPRQSFPFAGWPTVGGSLSGVVSYRVMWCGVVWCAEGVVIKWQWRGWCSIRVIGAGVLYVCRGDVCSVLEVVLCVASLHVSRVHSNLFFTMPHRHRDCHHLLCGLQHVVGQVVECCVVCCSVVWCSVVWCNESNFTEWQRFRWCCMRVMPAGGGVQTRKVCNM